MKRLLFLLLGLLGPSSIIWGQCLTNSLSSLGRLYTSTGNKSLDAKLNFYKVDLEDLFGITTKLYIYDDRGAPNARAIECRETSKCDGIIVFGYTLLLSELWRSEQGEYAVAGVMAHEAGHVLQYVRRNKLPPKLRELHADFLAGYYLGKRKFLRGGIDNFANSLFTKGDYNFWDPDHHGTPQERVNAMTAGFLAGRGDLSISEAYNEGIKYLVRLEKFGRSEVCGQCRGKGKIKVSGYCPSCGGYKAKTCSYCGGHGRYRYEGRIYLCEKCKGKGLFFCSKCGGTGVISFIRECPSCNGDGIVRR